ncbi:MAG: endonuclease III [Nanoarchaeota archaeon]
MQEQKRVNEILNILKKNYLAAKTTLRNENPLELLVATILSAQCTDERVNKVTPELFRKYKSAKDFAEADIKELESLIRSTGFYRNKAKNIKAACKIIHGKYGGKVPHTMVELIQLPGVARKTANIVLSAGYGIIDGIAVDTHVRRVSFRLGLTKNTDPNKIEQDLMKQIPRKEWADTSFRIILHGRAICKAPTPFCSKCPFNKVCPKVGVTKKY